MVSASESSPVTLWHTGGLLIWNFVTVIPKPSASDSEGLVIGWPAQSPDMTKLGELAKEIKAKIDAADG